MTMALTRPRRSFRLSLLAARVALLVIPLVLLPATTTAQDLSISVDRPCVNPDDTFVTTFSVEDDGNDRSWYWLGVYEISNVNRMGRNRAVLDGEPDFWVWSCGVQDCDDNPRRGKIRLGRDRPGEWVDSSWPPRRGVYRSVLVNVVEDEEEPIPYVAGAVSEPFEISNFCGDIEEQDPEQDEGDEGSGNSDGDDSNNDDDDDDDDSNNDDASGDDGATNAEENDGDDSETDSEPVTTPPVIMPTPGMAAIVRNARADIAALITARGSLAALYLRMVFHDCVSGGCDGCINIESQENGGLRGAMISLRDVETKYRDQGLTRADLFVLASYVGVDMTLPGGDALNNPFIPFQHYGRVTCDSSRPTGGPDPELCSPNLGTDEIVDFFQEHFDFTPQETAAIMGAHTVGVLRRPILGFSGQNGWVPNNTRFDNEYYEELVGGGSTLERQIEGAPQWRQALVNNTDLPDLPDRFQWEGFPGGRRVVMLNTDVAMVRQLDDSNRNPTTGQVSCKFVNREPGNRPRCPGARRDVFDNMVTYRGDNQRFIDDFRDALIKMTDTGYRVSTCDSDGMCTMQKIAENL